MRFELDYLSVYNSLYGLNLNEIVIKNTIEKCEKLQHTSICFIKKIDDIFMYSENYAKYLNISKKEKLHRYIEKLSDYMNYNNLDEMYHYNEFGLAFDVESMDTLDIKKLFNTLTMLSTVLSNDGAFKVFTSIDEVKKHLLDNLVGTRLSIQNYHFDLYVDSIEWSAGNLFRKVPKYESTGNSFIEEVQLLLEHDNKRIFFTDVENYYKMLYAVDVNYSGYDFIDLGRKFVQVNTSIHAENYKEYPILFHIDKTVKDSTEYEVYEYILKHLINGNEACLIDSSFIDKAIKHLTKKEDRDQKAFKVAEKIKTKFCKKMEKVRDGDIDSFIFNGIVFEKNKLSYENEYISCETYNWYTAIYNYVYYLRDVSELNWDIVFDLYLDKLSNNFNIEEFKISDISLKLDVRSTKTGYNSLYTVNGTRINMLEINQVCKNAIKFTSQKDYDDYLKDISKCSLKHHELLNTGISINVHDSFLNKSIKLKLPLTRVKNLNYLAIGTNLYRVSNTKKLSTISEKYRLDEVINILLNPSVIQINGLEDINYIISEGTKLYEKEKEANIKRIESVENMFNIKVESVYYSGVKYRGYKIKTQTSEYFLDIGNTDKNQFFDRMKVYVLPDFTYKCIIDKTIEQAGPSNLINRIFALHNDSAIAKHVEDFLI